MVQWFSIQCLSAVSEGLQIICADKNVCEDSVKTKAGNSVVR